MTQRAAYQYISSKRNPRENTGLLLNGAGALVVTPKRPKILNAFFSLVFNGKIYLQES